MILECIAPFSNLKPGDVVEVTEGNFDHSYFKEVVTQDSVPETSTEGA
jgi:hypothetical protein